MNSNAVAGPSHQLIPNASTSTSPASIAGPTVSDLVLELGNTTPSPLSGSQDLLSLFHLKPLYDTYVRPYPPPGSIVPPPIQQPIIETTTITTTGETKIKSLNGGLSIGFTMGGIKLGGGGIINADGTGIGIGEKEKSEKEKGKRTKIEKSYAHLVEDIPGRNTIRKDNHLNRLVLNPDFQPFQIKPFNSTTLREAFTLQTGQIPGFDTLIWESEDPNAPKKKKKKRKHDAESNAGVNGNNATGVGGDEESRKKKKRKGSETSGLQE